MAGGSGRSSGQGRSVLHAHPKLRLISSATKFSRRFSVDQTSAEKPFAALSDVIGISMGDWAFGNSLLCALRPCTRNRYEANQNECWNLPRKEKTTAGH